MLAIGRALLCNPRVLLLDEPFEGLAPLVCERIAEVLVRLKSLGMSGLLVEQRVESTLDVIDRAIVMDRGEIIYRGDPHVFHDPSIRAKYLGVGTPDAMATPQPSNS